MVDIDTQNIQKSVRCGRPIEVPWRFDEEGNLIVLNAKWTDYYHHNYINKYGNKVMSELCNRVVVQSKLNRHHLREICKRKRVGSLVANVGFAYVNVKI